MTTQRTFALARGSGLPMAIAAALFAAGSAFAQPDRPMGGPPVENRRPGQAEQRFGEPGREGRGGPAGMMQRQAVRHPEFMAVVWMMSDEEAPAALRLTPDQENRIAVIDREHQEATRAHAEKLRDLAQSARENAQRAGAERPAPPAGEQGEQSDERREAGRPGRAGAAQRISEEDREKLEQLRAGMPRPADAQARIFAVLSETQRAFVEEELEYRREIMERQRMEEMMRRRQAMREGGGPEGRGGFMGRGGPEAQAQRQRVGRIMMRLQQLPPEERDALVMRLEQELERRAKELGLDDLPERPMGGDGWRRFREGNDRREGEGDRPQRRRRGSDDRGQGGNPPPPR